MDVRMHLLIGVKSLNTVYKIRKKRSNGINKPQIMVMLKALSKLHEPIAKVSLLKQALFNVTNG